MAGGPSIYTANLLLNKSLRNTDFSPPTTFYVALFTTATNLRENVIASANEVANANAYVRKAVPIANIGAPASGSLSISVDVLFDAATGAWGNVSHAALLDSATWGAGNIWYYGSLTSVANIQNGDILKIPAGTFVIDL